MDRTAAHTKLKNDILAEIGCRDDILIVPTVSGVFRSLYGNRVVNAGAHKADIILAVAPRGRMVGIEVKTGNATLKKNQGNWKKALLKRGGFHITARSVQDALDGIEESKK